MTAVSAGLLVGTAGQGGQCHVSLWSNDLTAQPYQRLLTTGCALVLSAEVSGRTLVCWKTTAGEVRCSGLAAGGVLEDVPSFLVASGVGGNFDLSSGPPDTFAVVWETTPPVEVNARILTYPPLPPPDGGTGPDAGGASDAGAQADGGAGAQADGGTEAPDGGDPIQQHLRVSCQSAPGLPAVLLLALLGLASYRRRAWNLSACTRPTRRSAPASPP